MQKIVIAQRETLNWNSLNLEKFKSESIEFCRNWGKPDDFAYNLAFLWNNTFALDYFETRARLKDISQSQNSAISDTVFVPYEREGVIPEDGAAYLFVDDDDWFSPDLGSLLVTLNPQSYKFLLWRTTNIGSPNRPSPVFYLGLNGRCMTNNYAVSGDWIREEGSIQQVYSHAAAVHSLKLEGDIEQLDICMSVANKGPISSVSLDRGLKDSREPKKLLEMLNTYLTRMKTIEETDIEHIKWARTLLRDTVQIYQDVYDSRL